MKNIYIFLIIILFIIALTILWIRSVIRNITVEFKILNFEDLNLIEIVRTGLLTTTKRDLKVGLIINNKSRLSFVLDEIISIKIYFDNNLLAESLPEKKKLFISSLFKTEYERDIELLINKDTIEIIKYLIESKEIELYYIIKYKWLIFRRKYEDKFLFKVKPFNLLAML